MMTLGGTNFNASKERTVVSSAIQEVPKMQDSMQLEGILFLESILLPTSHSLWAQTKNSPRRTICKWPIWFIFLQLKLLSNPFERYWIYLPERITVSWRYFPLLLWWLPLLISPYPRLAEKGEWFHLNLLLQKRIGTKSPGSLTLLSVCNMTSLYSARSSKGILSSKMPWSK